MSAETTQNAEEPMRVKLSFFVSNVQVARQDSLYHGASLYIEHREREKNMLSKKKKKILILN